MRLVDFHLGEDAPPGASAITSGDTLELRWPSSADDRRATLGIAGFFVGAVGSVGLLAWVPTLPDWVPFVGAAVGVPAGVVLALLLPRSFVTLTASPSALRVRTSGVLFSFPVDLPRRDVRDVLVSEEQDGETRRGNPIMVHRLVAPLQSGGRSILVGTLKRGEYGEWVERCYARWVTQQRTGRPPG